MRHFFFPNCRKSRHCRRVHRREPAHRRKVSAITSPFIFQEHEMSPQENQVLQDFLQQLTQVKGMAKDPQADALIARAVAQQPDAAYLLVQRALLQEQALNAAKAQIAALQNQVQQAMQSGGGGSFLDSANAWGNTAVNAPRPVNPAAVAAAPQAPVQSPMPMARPGFLTGGGGSFLGNMAATAAGVAGGAFLFQGIENLLGHHGGAGLSGQHGMADLPAENAPVDNSADNTLNNDNDLALDAGVDDIGIDDDGSLPG
jgi:hypothetical protein